MGDGSRHGVRIDYSEETEPLGTVGPLAAIEDLDDSFLVMNGDVLTALDYGELMEAHRAAGNMLTIASHRRVVRTEYGVLHSDSEDGNMLDVVGLRGEAGDTVRRQHGRLHPRAGRARLHRAGPVPRPAGPGPQAARRRASRSAPTSTTGTGSTSDATRTTRRRSIEFEQLRPMFLPERAPRTGTRPVKVLVTGGAGYVGAELVDELLAGRPRRARARRAAARPGGRGRSAST